MTSLIFFIGMLVVTGLVIFIDDGQWDRKE